MERKVDKNFKNSDKNYILNQFNNKCFKCNSTNYLTIDHHIPLSRGFGLKLDNGSYNAVLLCKTCNNKKKDKLPQEFYTKKEIRILRKKYNIKSEISDRSKVLKSTINYKVDYINSKIEKNELIDFLYLDTEKNYKIEHNYNVIPKHVLIEKEFSPYGFERKYTLEGVIKGEEVLKRYNIKYIKF